MFLQSRFIEVNGVTLHVETGGNAAAETILFLHGFPSFWHSWQQQIDYFLRRNFFVVVPDQRGYNKSSKPQKVSDYRLQILVTDMAQLLSSLQITKAYVVAHDWGGIIAWALLKEHPNLFRKAVIINAPYLPSYFTFSFQQVAKSWYAYFFQLPFLPEWMAGRNRFSLLCNAMLRTSLPGTFSEESIALYQNAWQQPGSLRAMINWYRALMRYGSDAKKIFGQRTPVEIPVLVLWGKRDKFLKKESGICPVKHCPQFSIKVYEEATHWLPMERSEEVNDDIFSFFAS